MFECNPWLAKKVALVATIVFFSFKASQIHKMFGRNAGCVSNSVDPYVTAELLSITSESKLFAYGIN